MRDGIDLPAVAQHLIFLRLTHAAVRISVLNALKDIIEDGAVDREKSYCIDANYFKGGVACRIT